MITSEQINYQITSFNPKTGVLEILYDGMETPHPIELHLTHEDLYPTGKDLDVFIRAMAPIHLINKGLALKNGVSNAHEILKLVQPLPSPVSNTQNVSDLFSVLK